ncbi:LysE family translocator [Gilvimarinus xylanilyticus]|uniref:LysE family translocator n=1 Tax=Gilvimarinus xylanilyticus TaxID=2944139 RepID=A0A9X2I2Y9_9GAMM|nr:LysE family translocator [Gilvimarinus xylanilyticus]MCP8899091.1 LysE family translocator [Gilvimarinus xylanilyticus]
MNEALLAQVSIIMVMVGTPGPNNFLLLNSGVNFGVRRSIPLLAGILMGCLVMLLALATGLGQVFAHYPLSLTIMRVISAGFLAYLVIKLLQTRGTNSHRESAVKPLGFWQGAAFQWVNPKAWMMCLSLITAGVTHSDMAMLLIIFAVTALPLLLAWNLGGLALRQWLSVGTRLVWFNRAMALLLLSCVVMIF